MLPDVVRLPQYCMQRGCGAKDAGKIVLRGRIGLPRGQLLS